MIPVRTYRRPIGVLWLIGALLAPVCALAQEPPQTISVEVVVPRSALEGRGNVDRSIVEVILINQVSYQDLDLTTPAGELALRQRVAAVAREACEQIEKLYPRHTDSPAYCMREAIADSEGQIEAAIDDADHAAQESNSQSP